MNKALIKKITRLYPLVIFGLVLAMATTAFGQDGGGVIYLPLIMGGGNNGNATSTPTPTPTATFVLPTVTPTITATPSSVMPTITVAPPLTGQYPAGIVAEASSTTEDFRKIEQSGADWVSPGLSVNWAEIEPSEGERNWAVAADFEAQVLAANAQNQSVIAVLGNTPDWALLERDSGKCGPISTEKLPAFANFLQDLVSRYSRPPYNIRDWELWSAPESAVCWGSDDAVTSDGGVYYAIMLQTAYPAIRAVDPYAQVWMGPLEMRCHPSSGGTDCLRMETFLKGVLRSSSDFLDGIAFQALDGLTMVDFPWGTSFQYSNILWQSAWNTTGPVMNVKAAYLRDIMAQIGRDNGMPPKQLLAHVANQCPCGGDLFPEFESSKAGYLAQVMASAAAQGLYSARLQSWSGPFMSGLCLKDGSLAQAYTAMQVSNTSLKEATYTGAITIDDHLPAYVQGYRFRKSDREILVLWYTSPTQSQTSLVFAKTPLAVWDALGAVIPTNDVMLRLEQPIYVELPLP